MANYNVQQEAYDLVNRVGGAAAHSLFPLDLDTYYSMSLQLVDHTPETIDYFVWPVLPQQYQVGYKSLSTVKKTAGGTLSIKSQGFTPKSISLTGNFGKNFRVMVGQTHVSAKAWRFSAAGGDYTGGLTQIKKKPFMVGIKNGYGALKILEAICFKSNQLDKDGYPYTLFFYNPSFGESYVVNVDSININQTVQQMGLWQYQLSMTALNFVNAKFSTIRHIGVDTLQRALTGVLKETKAAIINEL